MTLAFVMGCPVGYALDIEELIAPHFGPLERALVIGADSRFTFLDGRSPNDRGAKAWHLEAGISAVFAGRVDNAERALSTFKRRLGESSERDVTTLSNWMLAAFDDVIPRNQRHGNHATSGLLGVRTLEEMACIKVNSQSDFVPSISHRAEVIGHPDAQLAFLRHLNDRIAPSGGAPASGGKMEIISSGSMLHSAAVTALQGAIGDVGGPVGGPIQTAILSARGTETFTTFAVDPDSWEGTSLKTERISARPEELRTWTKRDDRRLIPMVEADDYESIVGLDEGSDGRLYVTKSGWIARRTQ